MMVSIIPNLCIHLFISIDCSASKKWMVRNIDLQIAHFRWPLRTRCAHFSSSFFPLLFKWKWVRTKFRKYSDKFHNHRQFSVQSVASNYIITGDIFRTLLGSNQSAKDFINIDDLFNLSWIRWFEKRNEKLARNFEISIIEIMLQKKSLTFL